MPERAQLNTSSQPAIGKPISRLTRKSSIYMRGESTFARNDLSQLPNFFSKALDQRIRTQCDDNRKRFCRLVYRANPLRCLTTGLNRCNRNNLKSFLRIPSCENDRIVVYELWKPFDQCVSDRRIVHPTFINDNKVARQR